MKSHSIFLLLICRKQLVNISDRQKYLHFNFKHSAGELNVVIPVTNQSKGQYILRDNNGKEQKAFPIIIQ